MQVLADISVIPLGAGVSVSKYVAACEKVLEEAGLHPKLHAFGTNVEGDWDVVFRALRRCHEAVHELGAPRIQTTIRCSTRTDKVQSNEDRIASVRAKM